MLTVADTVIAARLADDAALRDVDAQTAAHLDLQDFNRVEKIATLRRTLSMAGVPAGAVPDIRDIGYAASQRRERDRGDHCP